MQSPLFNIENPHMSDFILNRMSESLNVFCKDAVSVAKQHGPISSGLLLVIMANTAEKEAAVDESLPLGESRVYVHRCGQERVLYHDEEDHYWDILYTVAGRRILSVQPWDGPMPSEPILDTAFCIHSD